MAYSPDFTAPSPMPQAWMPPDAPKPGVIPLRPLSFREVVGGAFATVRRTPVLLLGGTAAVLLLSQAASRVMTLPVIDDIQRIDTTGRASVEEVLPFIQRIAIGSGVSALIGLLGYVVLTGLATVVVGRAVIGKPITFSQAWQDLRPRLLRLTGVSIVYGMMLGLGGLLWVVPGIWAAVLFAFAAPALVLERLTVGEAFQRSRALVGVAWWRTFGFLLAAFGAAWVVGFVVALPFTDADFQLALTGELAGLTVSSVVYSSIVEVVSGVLTYPFVLAFTALVYIDRRIVVERLDIQLAQAAQQP